MNIGLQICQYLRIPLHIIGIILHHGVLQIEPIRKPCPANLLLLTRGQILTQFGIPLAAILLLVYLVPRSKLAVVVLTILFLGLERVGGCVLACWVVVGVRRRFVVVCGRG